MAQIDHAETRRQLKIKTTGAAPYAHIDRPVQ
jgi:hypothetical protein